MILAYGHITANGREGKSFRSSGLINGYKVEFFDSIIGFCEGISVLRENVGADGFDRSCDARRFELLEPAFASRYVGFENAVFVHGYARNKSAFARRRVFAVMVGDDNRSTRSDKFAVDDFRDSAPAVKKTVEGVVSLGVLYRQLGFGHRLREIGNEPAARNGVIESRFDSGDFVEDESARKHSVFASVGISDAEKVFENDLRLGACFFGSSVSVIEIDEGRVRYDNLRDFSVRAHGNDSVVRSDDERDLRRVEGEVVSDNAESVVFVDISVIYVRPVFKITERSAAE